MSDGNLLLTLRQINICLGFYESEKLTASKMTFAYLLVFEITRDAIPLKIMDVLENLEGNVIGA